MGQPVLPKWQKLGARCTAKINGQSYSAVITQEGDYGYFKVKTATRDHLNGGYRIADYGKPVSYTHLKQRFTYVPGLDTPEEEEIA